MRQLSPRSGDTAYPVPLGEGQGEGRVLAVKLIGGSFW